MNRAIIILIILFLIILSIFGYMYFKYEKPAQKQANIQFANLSIMAKYNNKAVVTDYELLLNNFEKRQSKTLEQGFVLEVVAVNTSIKLYNINGSYYKSEVNQLIDKSDTYRLILELEKIGNLSFSSSRIDEKDINLLVSSAGATRNLTLCFKWSTHLISIELINYTGVRTDNYDRCFYTNKNLKDETLNLTLKYNNWGELDEKDSIEVFGLDELGILTKYNINNIYKI